MGREILGHILLLSGAYMKKVYTRKRQTRDGYTWEWRFELPNTDGKRKQLSKSGYRSEHEALAAGYAALAEYNRTRNKEGKSMTMEALLSEYTEKILFPGLSKGTADNYRAIVSNHIVPEIGDLSVAEVNSGRILDLYNGVRLKGVSMFPLEGIRRILGGAFEYALMKDYIGRNPMDRLKFPKSIAKHREKTAYTPQQINRMALSLPPENDRRLPFSIAALTGMRESEIAGLAWENIDMENRVIRVREQLHCGGTEASFGPTKNGVVREIPFRGRLAAVLENARIRQQNNEKKYGALYIHTYRLPSGELACGVSGQIKDAEEVHLVCTKADGRNISAWDFKAISRIIRKAGAEDFSFHVGTRHSHTTECLDAGASLKAVADRLGHKDIRTTLGIYAHVSPEARNDTADRIERSFSDNDLKLVESA